MAIVIKTLNPPWCDNNEKKILFVDNDKDFLETRVERLEKEGYQVYQAASREEAEALLKDIWLHVGIIDMRLRDDTDEEDRSGLILANKELYRHVSMIILTSHASHENTRLALASLQNGRAVDFISKLDGIEPMLRAVEKVFERHVDINWELVIQWGEISSFEYLLKLRALETKRDLLSDRADELEDLFRKLFAESTQITINRCLYEAKGRVVLDVFAYGEAGEQRFLVSCGQKDSITNEASNFERLASPNIALGCIIKSKMVETLHFAATIYSLVECNVEQTCSFKQFYASHSAEQIVPILRHLFDVTLAHGHGKKRSYGNQQKSLSDAYYAWWGTSQESLDKNAFEQRVQAICGETLKAGLPPLDYSAQTVTFHLANGQTISYSNPVSLLLAPPFSDQPILYDLTHGQVNVDTVLVDRQGQSWLLDFSQAGVGPLLRDWVSLEIAIKLKLLDTLDLHDRHHLETQLLAGATFSDIPLHEAASVELKKALKVIQTIRCSAAQLPNNNDSSYLEGLFFSGLKYLLSYNPNINYPGRNLLPYAHTLLSVAMLAQTLQPNGLPAQAYHSLWIDEENKDVWVEGRQVDLSPLAFKILFYLYQNEGKPCSRQKIVKNVYDEKYDKITHYDSLNNAILRLRQKIEHNPHCPKYLITKRGKGYKLVLA